MPPPRSLSSRQQQVLDHLAAGLSCEESARRLFLTPNTVKQHRARLYRALQVDGLSATGAAAVAVGFRRGYLTG